MANYEYVFKNDNSDTYRVRFMDTTISEDVYSLVWPTPNGANIGFEGGSDETYKAIQTSSFSCSLFRDTNSRQLLSELSQSTMGRFQVVFSKLTAPLTYTNIWYGFVIQDSMQKPDTADNTNGYINIQASDGFGELQDQEWTGFNISTPLAQRTAIEWLALIMTKMPLTYASGTIFSTASVWYENSMPHTPTDDPMAMKKFNEAAFADVDDYGVIKGRSYYEILTYILEAFNLQIKHWNGRYLLIQQNTYCYQTTTRVWNYDKAGTYITTELINLQAVMQSRMSGGVFTYLAPIRKIQTEYEYKQGIYKNNLFPDIVEIGTTYSLGLSSVGAIISFSGVLQLDYQGGDGDPTRIKALYKLTIKNGSHYLNNDLEWTTDSDNYVLITTGSFKGYSIDVTVFKEFSFATILPEDIQPITFSYDFFELHFASSDLLFTPTVGEEPIMTHSTVKDSFKSSVSGTEDMEGTLLYSASVNETIKYDLQLNNSIIGDGPSPLSAGAIKVFDGSGWVNSDNWTIYSEIGGTAMLLHQLRCREMLALRRVTTVFYQGSFIGTPDIFKGFSFEGHYWVWISLDWNCSDNTFTGTALQLSYVTDPG